MSKKGCRLEGSHVIPCSALANAAEFGTPPPAHTKRTGVFAWRLTNIETHKPSRTMFGAKTTAHPKGLIFNFCPWCGVDLQGSHSAKKGPAA